MAIKKLTETSVSKMPEKVLYDSEIKGFCIRIRKTGKFFSFEYKSPVSFTNRRTTIGKYGTITVEKAREAAKRLAGVVALGSDPLEQKEEQKQSIKRQSQSSLRLFLHKGFLEVTPDPTAKKIIAFIERHFASLLDKPMSEITAWETYGFAHSPVSLDCIPTIGLYSDTYFPVMLEKSKSNISRRLRK